MKSSPSRVKRGAFGSHMSGFVVTISSSRKTPPRSALSCATIKSFQPVSASGTVNVNDTLPSASVSRFGKKNAVSFRLLRGGSSFCVDPPASAGGASAAGAISATAAETSPASSSATIFPAIIERWTKLIPPARTLDFM